MDDLWVDETVNQKERALARAMERGDRVRALIGDRKMKLSGVVLRSGDGSYALRANWGKLYEVPTDETLKELEVADSVGRFRTLPV